ncbi:MAG: hypothetical protein JW765_12755 [Deltaproteobacteria bacterium]|nr:hypothetical protein [Candidatus Zymogenaceae bacterium]
MNRSIVSFLIVLFLAFFISGTATAASITQKVVTVSIPNDYSSAEAYKVEFSIPDGSTAFNFTLWGTNKTWGIADISGGAYKEIYSSGDNGSNGDTPIIDAESPERVVSPPTENEVTDPLSRLTLYPGSYIIWMEGKPGASMTLQYNLRMVR